MGPESNMIGVLIKRRNLDTDTHMGRMPREDEDRDLSNVSISQGKSKIANKPPEPR